ncbi:unnamed protein product [Bursaphelenchus xylophilus]|uniref:(pine wood nematode) hypothetical protein n=1 Tax=Bursaphelenchus xylophilus TaxID=6326 RepID=A0A1I7RZD5_BURXY|nr:unnamed protein product [Bursaphelenchus xylophilus]CAG9106560.1 unnamed protein product [Bursaphelenchus xylophilus]
MGLSREEVEKLLEPIESRLDEGLEKQDAAQAASCYTDNAVLVHLGKNAVTTRAAIEARYKEFLTPDFGKIITEKTAAYDVNDGEFLLRKGRYQMGKDQPWFKYMQLFERQPDGKYLVLHDEFEFN